MPTAPSSKQPGKRQTPEWVIRSLENWGACKRECFQETGRYEIPVIVRLGSFDYEGKPKGQQPKLTQVERDAEANKKLYRDLHAIETVWQNLHTDLKQRTIAVVLNDIYLMQRRPSQLAELYGISERTLFRWLSKGQALIEQQLAET